MEDRLGEPRQLIPTVVPSSSSSIRPCFATKEHAVGDDVHVGRQGMVELLPAHLLDHVRDARGEDEEGHLGALFICLLVDGFIM